MTGTVMPRAPRPGKVGVWYLPSLAMLPKARYRSPRQDGIELKAHWRREALLLIALRLVTRIGFALQLGWDFMRGAAASQADREGSLRTTMSGLNLCAVIHRETGRVEARVLVSNATSGRGAGCIG